MQQLLAGHTSSIVVFGSFMLLLLLPFRTGQYLRGAPRQS